ncbi:hypothetical protein O3M35_001905 [Rhynocoris fuscipes]|uniref:Uncharacterized protein n=1 Tax=Rhynocoris fuscipes TaxID=488301 RepID=A0AAW1CP40_9HEMI
MLGADCSSINLVSIPKITRDVEILDASFNRIRILKNDSFTTFYSLKFLYLGDNSISIIEAGAFAPLEYLEVLDLSLNAIRDLPPLLPETLRRLYIAENPLETVPLAQATNLQFVSLASSFLTVLPDLGELPNLKELNLTDNPLEIITVRDLASFCHLENLHLPMQLFQTKFTTTCDCLKLNTWIVKHSIFVDPQLNCTIVDENACITNSTTEEETAFAACQLAYQTRAATHWAVVVCTALVVLICAIVLTILLRRRWRRPSPTPGPSQEEVRKRRLLQKTQSKNSLKF